jgi:hypothetical protein
MAFSVEKSREHKVQENVSLKSGGNGFIGVEEECDSGGYPLFRVSNF